MRTIKVYEAQAVEVVRVYEYEVEVPDGVTDSDLRKALAEATDDAESLDLGAELRAMGAKVGHPTERRDLEDVTTDDFRESAYALDPDDARDDLETRQHGGSVQENHDWHEFGPG